MGNVLCAWPYGLPAPRGSATRVGSSKSSRMSPKGHIHGAWHWGTARHREQRLILFSLQKTSREPFATHTSLHVPTADLFNMHAEQIEIQKGRCVLQLNVEGKWDASIDIIVLLMPFKTGSNLQQLEDGCNQTAHRVPGNTGKLRTALELNE